MIKKLLVQQKKHHSIIGIFSMSYFFILAIILCCKDVVMPYLRMGVDASYYVFDGRGLCSEEE